MSLATDQTPSLLEAYRQLREEVPKIRIRDAAERLGVKEVQLLAASCGQTVTRLEGSFSDFLFALPSLGRVMTLTRNNSAVHETKGRFEDVSVDGQVGLVVGSEIDLRVFFFGWSSMFAVEEPSRDGIRRSLQVFDAYGDAVHKVFLQESSDLKAFHQIVERFRSPNQDSTQSVKSGPPAKSLLPDSEIDIEGLRKAWQALTDTHDFFPMLKTFKVDRLQALRLAGDELAWPVALDSPRRILEAAAASELPIMVFVGSRGVIQIFSGKVKRVKEVGNWINVLDPDFNLHLREDLVASAWVVRKPTSEGNVTALEIFDAEGENIALFFGEGPRHVEEDLAWRELVESLPRTALE